MGSYQEGGAWGKGVALIFISGPYGVNRRKYDLGKRTCECNRQTVRVIKRLKLRHKSNTICMKTNLHKL